MWRRKFVHTTDSKHDLPIAANMLARQFNPAAPDKAFVSDITYIRTAVGWRYLAVVIDLFSRKVAGWAMAPGMPARLVCDALYMALQDMAALNRAGKRRRQGWGRAERLLWRRLAKNPAGNQDAEPSVTGAAGLDSVMAGAAACDDHCSL